MYSVLLDTDILLDYHLGRGECGAQCAELIRRLLEGGSVVMVAASTLKDEFYLIERLLKREAAGPDGAVSAQDARAIRDIAWACIRQAMEIAQVVDVGIGDCLRAAALRSLHGDFEDNLVAAAGERCKVDYLVTNDRRLQRHAAVRCLTSKEMLDLLDAK